MEHVFAALRPPPKHTGPFPLDGQDLSIVSRNQIKRALEHAPAVYNGGSTSTRIAQITKDVVVKYGTDVYLSEARNMKFVEERSGGRVRLPRVIDAWEEMNPETEAEAEMRTDTRESVESDANEEIRSADEGEKGDDKSQATESDEPNAAFLIADNSTICYIVMTFIHGDRLHEIWSDLDDSSRYDINLQLYDMLEHLHTLKLDLGLDSNQHSHIQSHPETPATPAPTLISTPTPTPTSIPGPIGGGFSMGPLFTIWGAGPFRSQADIERWFNNRLLVCHDVGILSPTGFTHPGAFDGHFKDLVMCHMDLHLHNLIIDANGKIWILDWAFAGMYPPYFDMAVLRFQGWYQYFPDLLALLDYEKYSKEIGRFLEMGFAFTTGAFCKPRSQNIS